MEIELFLGIMGTIAAFTMVFIVWHTARSAKLSLKEERNSKRIIEIKYRLENLYSPSETIALDYLEQIYKSLSLSDLVKFSTEFINGYREISFKYSFMAQGVTEYVNKVTDEYSKTFEKQINHMSNLDPDFLFKCKNFMNLKVEDTDSLEESVINLLSYINHMIEYYIKLLDDINEDDICINIQKEDIIKMIPKKPTLLKLKTDKP